jgi:hypothetical protein
MAAAGASGLYVNPNTGAAQAGLMPFRNALINGNFDIWQRGTTFTSASIGYCTDRWTTYKNGTGSMTVTRELFTLGQTDVPNNPTYFCRLSQTTAGSGTSYSSFNQYIENIRTFAGRTVTLSFYAKSDVQRTLTLYFNQYFGSGGSAEVNTTSLPFTLTTAWNKYNLTFNIPSISGKTVTSNDYLRLLIELPFNTVYTFDFSQFQLELGSVATPFEVRPYSVELQLCQRYYVRDVYNLHGGGVSISSTLDTIVGIYYKYPTTMRIAPNLTFLGTTARSGATRDAEQITPLYFIWGRQQYGGGTGTVYAFAIGGCELSAEL